MKPFEKIILCLLITALLWLPAGCGETRESAFTNIDAAAAFDMSEKDGVLLLDVRTPAEYKQAHIRDAVLIPVQVLETEYKKIEAFKDKTVLIYCRSGNRSVTASNILLKQGFKKVYNLKGGIIDWIKNRYPVISAQ